MISQDYINLQIKNSEWSYNNKWGDQMEDAIINWFSKSITDKNANILDIGCGEGRGLSALIQNGFINTVGVDIAKDKLFAGRLKGLNLRYCDIHDLNIFKENEFDYMFCSHTLEHMLDLKTALKSIMRVGKILYYIIPIHERKEYAHYFNASHTSMINKPEEFLTILDSLGFHHEHFTKTRLSDELWGVVTKL